MMTVKQDTILTIKKANQYDILLPLYQIRHQHIPENISICQKKRNELKLIIPINNNNNANFPFGVFLLHIDDDGSPNA